MTDLEEPTEPDTDATVDLAPVEPSATPRAALILAISIAVVLGVVSLALAVRSREDGVGTSGATASLREASGQVGQALLTYDYKDPKAHKDGVLALATGSFRTEYQRAFDQGLGALITKVKATSKGFVKDVYVSEIDHDQAETIVVADVTRDGAGGKRTLYDIYILLSFVKVKGTWKVDQVTDLNFAQAGADGATTSTSVPVP
jgi:hypothetical protein